MTIVTSGLVFAYSLAVHVSALTFVVLAPALLLPACGSSTPEVAPSPVTAVAVTGLPTLVNAGADREVVPGDHVCLDGTNSYDPLGLSFTLAWSQVVSNSSDKVYLSNVAATSPCFVAPLDEQTLTFTLTADNGTFVTQDSVTFIVTSEAGAQAPQVRGGPDRFLESGQSSQPDASDVASTDANTTVAWTALATTRSAHNGNDVAILPGIFQLTATDTTTKLASLPDYVLLWPHADGTKRAAPTVVLNANTTGTTSATFQMGAIGTLGAPAAANDTIRYRWQQTCGDATLGTPGNVSSVYANYSKRAQVQCFRVTARDNFLESAPADVLVMVLPPQGQVSPTASPQREQPVHAGNNVTLNADPNAVNGSNTVYLWQQTTGPYVNTTAQGSLQSFTAPATGAALAFTVSAQTSQMSSDNAVSVVRVVDANTNTAPVVTICASTQSPTASTTVEIYGSAFDPEQDPLASIGWSESPEGAAPISGATAVAEWPVNCGPQPTLNGLRPLTTRVDVAAPASGTQAQITLTVCDSLNACGTASVTLTTP